MAHAKILAQVSLGRKRKHTACGRYTKVADNKRTVMQRSLRIKYVFQKLGGYISIYDRAGCHYITELHVVLEDDKRAGFRF